MNPLMKQISPFDNCGRNTGNKHESAHETDCKEHMELSESSHEENFSD